MCDFDLSQALDCPFDLDKTGFESGCFNMMDVHNEIIRIDDGLDLVVSRNKKTMKCVANIVLAVNRIKKASTLSNDELCSAIMDSLVEETIVETAEIPCTAQTNRTYVRMSSSEYTLSDSEQKALICTSESFQLHATTLKGGYDDYRANFKQSNYIPSTRSEPEAVGLSIKNTNFHISCSMNGDKAVLKLEECSKEHLMNIQDGNMQRFLFYKKEIEKSKTKFESVMCAGWFISTSYDQENQPVEMCTRDKKYRIFNFLMS